MLTSHCQSCGVPKDPSTYALDFCAGCQTAINEAREFVTRENAEREKFNAEHLTPERKAAMDGAIARGITGDRRRELARELGFKEPLDPVAIRREALLKRSHSTNSGHADPRTPWNPGLRDARAANLGMASHVPPGRTLVPGTRAEGE